MLPRLPIVAVLVTSVAAGPLDPRQLFGSLGSLSCNAARLRIVTALGRAGSSVEDIQDPTVQSGAQAGLDQANEGVGEIARAIFSGDAPPQTSRDKVENGLNAMGNALGNGTTTDEAVQDAGEALDDAVAAGKDVVAEC